MANRSLHPLLHYLRRLGGAADDSARDDAQLLHRFLADGEQAAFTTIVQRYGAMVWGLCVRRLGETPDAEDAFQATFLVLVRKAATLRSAELLGPWLHGVAYRTALKVRGRRARQTAREMPLPQQVAAEQTEPVWSDLRPVIDEEVNRLPEKYRQPVVLCYLQGMSCAEAARLLGCAQGTIFSRLSQARELLRKRLSKRGLGVSVGALATVLTEKAARALPPGLLLETTIRTSVMLAAGTAGQTLSAPLAALVEGVLRSMFLSKVQFVVVVLLALGLVGSGAGFVAHHTAAGQPGTKPTPQPLPAAKAEDKKPNPKPNAEKPKAEDKKPNPKPNAEKPFVPVRLDKVARLREWRERLTQPIQFDGTDDQVSLGEILEILHKLYGVTFEINRKVLDDNNITLDTPIGKIPAMRNSSLANLLRVILGRLDSAWGMVYVRRSDSVEITTRRALQDEWESEVLPLVWGAFEETSIAKVLAEVTETTGFNVIVDQRVVEKVQVKITLQFNNVPTDTAVRLLANMAGVSVVRLDNVFYLTTAENAKALREEQADINVDRLGEGTAKPVREKKPAK